MICYFWRRCPFRTRPCPETGLVCDGASPHEKTGQCSVRNCARFDHGRRRCVEFKGKDGAK